MELSQEQVLKDVYSMIRESYEEWCTSMGSRPL